MRNATFIAFNLQRQDQPAHVILFIGSDNIYVFGPTPGWLYPPTKRLPDTTVYISSYIATHDVVGWVYYGSGSGTAGAPSRNITCNAAYIRT